MVGMYLIYSENLRIADIGLCLVGKPPSKRLEAVKPDHRKLERRIAKNSKAMKSSGAIGIMCNLKG